MNTLRKNWQNMETTQTKVAWMDEKPKEKTQTKAACMDENPKENLAKHGKNTNKSGLDG